MDLGLPDLTPREAAARGIRTLIIGIANDGGFIAPHWVAAIVAALEAGLDVASGLHEPLAGVPEIAAAARAHGPAADRGAPAGQVVHAGHRQASAAASAC